MSKEVDFDEDIEIEDDRQLPEEEDEDQQSIQLDTQAMDIDTGDSVAHGYESEQDDLFKNESHSGEDI